MSNHRMTRRKMLSGVAITTTVAIAGCTSDDNPMEPTNNSTNASTEENGTMTEAENSTSVETPDEETETTTETNETETTTDQAVGNPSSDSPVYETNVVETRNHVEAVVVETQNNDKYLGETIRVPNVRYSIEFEDDFFVFELLEDGGSTGTAIVVPKDVVSATPEQDAEYSIEGELLRIGNLSGGDQMVLGGKDFVLEAK